MASQEFRVFFFFRLNRRNSLQGPSSSLHLGKMTVSLLKLFSDNRASRTMAWQPILARVQSRVSAAVLVRRSE